MKRKIMKRPYEPWEPIDESFYTQEGRALLIDEDAISSEEDGFMQGYDEASSEINENWINEWNVEEVY